MPRRARRNHNLLGQKSGRACSAAAAAAALPRPASSARSSHLHSAPRAGGARWRHLPGEGRGVSAICWDRSQVGLAAQQRQQHFRGPQAARAARTCIQPRAPAERVGGICLANAGGFRRLLWMNTESRESIAIQASMIFCNSFTDCTSSQLYLCDMISFMRRNFFENGTNRIMFVLTTPSIQLNFKITEFYH